jgi:hypothetical protein
MGSPQTTYWTNADPAVNQDRFLKERYACLLETQKPVSAASIGQYGGSAESQVVPSCTAFNACLLAHGYSKAEQGNLVVNRDNIVKCSN